MAVSPPATDGFEAQGFDGLSRLVLDIPAATFDGRAAAFDAMAAALHDVADRLRVQLDRLRELLRGVAGDAADEVGESLRGEISAVATAISGDGMALYRAGDALAGAQRAMRDLGVERARALAATPTPQVAAQFDERARQIATGLAQAFREVGMSLPAIPGASAPAGGSTGDQAPPAPIPKVVFVASTGNGTQPPPETGFPPPVTTLSNSAFGVGTAILPPPGTGGTQGRGTVWTAGVPDAVPGPVLGRGASSGTASLTAKPPGDTGGVLPPAVLGAVGAAGTTSGGATASAHTAAAARTGPQRNAPGRTAGEQAAGTILPPLALGAGEQQARTGTGGRGTSASRGETLADHVAGSSAESAEVQATVGAPTARVPEYEATPPVLESSTQAGSQSTAGTRRQAGPGAAFAGVPVFEDGSAFAGGTFERNRSGPSAVSSLTSPSATSLHSTSVPLPDQVTGPTAQPGYGTPPPMVPPMGMGPMGGIGLTARVEADREREVSLNASPGEWEDDVGGAPAVLGRR
jgi:hypothetical protein